MNSGIFITQKDASVEVQMNHSKANKINPEFITAFIDAFSQIPKNKPIILSGNNRFFSSGLDIFYVHNLVHNEMHSFINKFQSLLQIILDHQSPIIASISGHAVAGGFMLASACDHAFCSNGQYKLGMNESRLDIKLPPLLQAIIECTFTEDISKIMNLGQFFSPSEIIQFPHFSMGSPLLHLNQIKSDRLEKINQYMHIHAEFVMDKFLESWFSGKAIHAREKLIAQLSD